MNFCLLMIHQLLYKEKQEVAHSQDDLFLVKNRYW
jgi:hypothetical protein